MAQAAAEWSDDAPQWEKAAAEAAWWPTTRQQRQPMPMGLPTLLRPPPGLPPPDQPHAAPHQPMTGAVLPAGACWQSGPAASWRHHEGDALESAESPRRQETTGSTQSGTTTADGSDFDPAKALMLKNIPSRSTVSELISVIEEIGFGRDFTFLYMPQREGPRQRVLNKGYAFVGFANADVCASFATAISGRNFSPRDSAKTIQVAPARLQSYTEVMDSFMDLTTLNSRKAFMVVKSLGGQLEQRYIL